MNQVLGVPAFAGSRAGAREFVAPLAGVARDQRVRLEFGRTKAVAPSFIDEVVRALLVEQQAGHLELHDASERAVELALRFAANHKVADRLTCTRRQASSSNPAATDPPGSRAAHSRASGGPAHPR